MVKLTYRFLSLQLDNKVRNGSLNMIPKQQWYKDKGQWKTNIGFFFQKYTNDRNIQAGGGRVKDS